MKKLVFLPPATVNATLYQQKCLKTNLALLKTKTLVQDGARAHAAATTATYLKKRGIRVLQDWPPRSPDLNPIENLWGILTRRVSDCGPTDEKELHQYIKQVWDEYPQCEIDKLVNSFSDRIKKCVKVKGKKVK